jgi:hypothetical protein
VGHLLTESIIIHLMAEQFISIVTRRHGKSTCFHTQKVSYTIAMHCGVYHGVE